MKNEYIEVENDRYAWDIKPKFRCISKDKLPYSVVEEDGEKVHIFKLSDILA